VKGIDLRIQNNIGYCLPEITEESRTSTSDIWPCANVESLSL
jgi:hypothetical protein